MAAYPEGSAVGDANWEVGKDGEEPVRRGGAEGEVVGNFMDGEEEVLVGCCADDVGGEEEREGENCGISKAYGTGQLQCYDPEDHILGQWLRPAEFGDLGIVSQRYEACGEFGKC